MKSHVRSLLEIGECIYRDAAAKCVDDVFSLRDLKTLKSRVKHEGLSFLTITLPSLGQDLENCLEHGQIETHHFRAWRKVGKAPAFLRGFFSHVFDETGRTRNEPCPICIEGIRQVAYAFKKLQVPCAPQRVRRALDSFVQSERVFDVPISEDDLEEFSQVSRVLWSSVFNHEVNLHDTIPKHGPGATAERINGNQKYALKTWHDRLENYFPMLDYAFANAEAKSSIGFEGVTVAEEADEQPVRVITVPKTLKAPRIIAIEPVCMQYTQQALSELIVNRLENHRFTAGHVNFTNQQINRDLALSSSADGRFATLDLSSASDRVPCDLALSMFNSHPDLRDAIYACRSKNAEVPSGDVIPLRKFASMGSALCFPVEAMYFYTCCVLALLKKHDLPVSYPNIEFVRDKIYVYGDDIIVPVDSSNIVSETLQKYYCKVNTTKSFSRGKFRESCGMDAFAGEEVTPTYVRRLIPTNKHSASELVSLVATANLFYERGYWLTSSRIFDYLEKVLGKLPILGDNSAGLGKSSFQNYVTAGKWCTKIHTFKVKAWVPGPVYQTDILEDDAALLKCLLHLERRQNDDASSVDTKHLMRSARHGAVALKRRWTSPY